MLFLEVYLGGLGRFLGIVAKKGSERVGVLIGAALGERLVVKVAYPVRNILHSKTEFLADPLGIISSYKLSEAYGLDVVGLYHTHPLGGPTPSSKDLYGMKLWPIPWVIASKNGMRAWLLKGEDLIEVKLIC